MKSLIDPADITFVDTVVTYLKMETPPAEKLPPMEGVSFRLWPKPIDVESYRRVYYGVGKEHHWVDRLVMPEEEVSALINDEKIDIYVMEVGGETAGYCEFIKEKAFTEILYFGLLPAFIGKGLGKYFLRRAIEHAWSYGVQWIQLNTCGLDHPHALNNYKRNGFVEVRQEVHSRRKVKG